jgi:alcohol dehydrogenase
MIAVHLQNGRVELREVPAPERKPGEALIRLVLAGICNTDLELQRGYYAFSGIPGHEFVGEVIAADNAALVGRRVVGEINLPCNNCEWCRRGLARHCHNRTVLGIAGHPGAFAELLTLPEANLHVLSDAIPTRCAVFTEPLAAAFEILEQAAIPAGAEVAVLGDGKLGLLIAQALAASGLRVRLYGRHREKLAIAARAGIATELAAAELPAAAYDWVVEATGSAAGLAQAVGMVRPRGTVVMKSTVHNAVPLDAAPVIVNEITLLGSRCGRFEPALDLLARNAVDVESMIAAEYPLRDAECAFAHASRGGTLKVLLRF